MAKTVHARTVAVQSLDYKYGKIVVPPYEVDIEFTPQEEAALDSGVSAGMIPSDASQSNKFATERYVEDKVVTYTARFQGTYNLISDLGLTTAATYEEISAELDNEISGADNNDYCYVQVPIDDDTPTRIQKTDRYKFDGTDWAYEFTVSDTDLIQQLYNILQYSDVYVGAAAAYSSIISNSYHYDSIVRGRPINISNASNDYIWVVLPADYSPVVLLSGIEMKISLEGTTTISSKSYKIWKSTNIYTGTFNLYLL